ncbi:1-(5-phosphoribosyl)-5-[(5-phosphoribosylamino)methylideneamino]imidazole-4-carboxamide isomerase [Sporosarcina trichiuri]|uniref:1-(5-phosphoribosyl)-5-[(5- phosphoribosylamino)methylideneamino]imidazole-4- carboxamide isomerase n=1 Tax=Sporosarcina trichiuri TaxID=3056445 RepID=UPI0025B53CA7|nr:1-(5-phosphoribosyl)-5-[(5-phosphoribosylamino)methylideneamino]imidazole-4-carboxamide isomerase [Sporosarcina sp. 0.2-SM1T-5]WJY27890.1 1-(5-phosphoribosyl)-5-[(5-phosphoribosylamino)methylideneamino]imidazole-4-carboxamide isomerase [Sporosarcina sp. 0.2-SM1T-5]
MILLPAIDIRQGKCVRLVQGDFGRQTVYHDSPLEMAWNWAGKGAEWLHVVDLDGAESGRSVNRELVLSLAEKIGIPIQLGGGIRSIKTIDEYLAAGIERVILGTAAIEDPRLLERAVENYGNRIAVSIDTKNGIPTTAGWTGTAAVSLEELLQRLIGTGIQTVIYTDIGKDGMLSGPNFSDLNRLRQNSTLNIIASGGVTTAEDVRRLKEDGFHGAIAGKAIYENEGRFEEMMGGLS